MEILFLGDGLYLVDEVTDDVIEGPFNTVEEAKAVKAKIMDWANWGDYKEPEFADMN